MKNNKLLSAILLVALVAGFSSCKKKGCTDPNSLAYNEEAKKDDGSCTYPTSTTKNAVVFEFTGTWCPYCGDYGGTWATDIDNDNTKTDVVAVHINDEFSVSIGEDLQTAFNSGGYPSFHVGEEEISQLSYNTLSNLVSDELGAASTGNFDYTYSLEGNTMTASVQTKISGTGSGYTLAAYVIENGQVAEQNTNSGPDANYVHNHILRKEANGSAFGADVAFTDGNNVTDFSIDLSSISGAVAANCHLLVVLWKDGVYVNSTGLLQ